MRSDHQSFEEFYADYLAEHRDRTCRRLHFVGTGLTPVVLVGVLVKQQWLWFLALPLLGYGFAWFGHFFFEKNRPATFHQPLYSLAADFVMFKDILVGRIPF